MKKILKVFTLLLVVITMLPYTAMLKEQPVAINFSPQVKYITPKEMDILIEKTALEEDNSH